MFKLLKYRAFYLLFEHFIVILLMKPILRIEVLLFYPVLLLNLSLLCTDFYTYPHSKLKSNTLSLKIVFVKLKSFVQAKPQSIVLLSNVILLFFYSEKINTSQIYTYYYLHYIIFFFYFFAYTSYLPRIYRVLVLFFVLTIELLMMHYEHITDYSMTDQTDEMMKIIHILYICLLIFNVLLAVLPRKLDKNKLLSLPLIMLYFFVASQDQRTYLLGHFLLALWILISCDNVFLMPILGITSYILVHGTFGFDISLRAGNHSWGYNPDQYPIFTGFIFGVHKLSWFMISGCSMLASKSFSKVFQPMILRSYASILIFLWVFCSYPSSTLSVFMWCMGQCLTLILSHSFGLLAFPCKIDPNNTEYIKKTHNSIINT